MEQLADISNFESLMSNVPVANNFSTSDLKWGIKENTGDWDLFSSQQQAIIKKGIDEGLEVRGYANPMYTPEQMQLGYEAAKHDIDLEPYFTTNRPISVAKKALEEQLTCDKDDRRTPHYRYSKDQRRVVQDGSGESFWWKIRTKEDLDTVLDVLADTDSFDFDDVDSFYPPTPVPTEFYQNPHLSPSQMQEILYGLRVGLGNKVKWYADPLFSAEQMAVLREALVRGMDVSHIARYDYSADKMAEIVRKELGPTEDEKWQEQFEKKEKEQEEKNWLEIQQKIADHYHKREQVRKYWDDFKTHHIPNLEGNNRGGCGYSNLDFCSDDNPRQPDYDKPRWREFSRGQQEAIEDGLRYKEDVSWFADPSYSPWLMRDISKSLRRNKGPKVDEIVGYIEDYAESEMKDKMDSLYLF